MPAAPPSFTIGLVQMRCDADPEVNLERALTPAKPLGGHLMSGHVDGVGILVEKHEDARSWRLTFEAPQALARYIARKGSIAIDGHEVRFHSPQDSHRAGCDQQPDPDGGRRLIGVVRRGGPA